MFRLAVALFVAGLMSACVTTPPSAIPGNYSGPVATIKDSVVRVNDTEADLFYLTHVDGQAVQDSLGATRARNYGRGLAPISAVALSRPVVPRDSVFRVAGRTEHSAPILSLTSNVYGMKGEIRFTPEAGKRYVVRGKFNHAYSVIWIEEEGTQVAVGNKVEVNGSATLGFLEK